MARYGGRVISIYYAPVSNSDAAEAGVWTHPDFRGQGQASATTAEWTALMRSTGMVLFYSTSRTQLGLAKGDSPPGPAPEPIPVDYDR